MVVEDFYIYVGKEGEESEQLFHEYTFTFCKKSRKDIKG
jgi:hypothetical protein